MTPEIQDPLTMLDMTEEEQIAFLNRNLYEYGHNDIGISLADLAFRLRDEVVLSNKCQWAWPKVYNAAHHFKLEVYEIDAPTTSMWIWFATQAEPIHWIIAALIAKQLAKGE